MTTKIINVPDVCYAITRPFPSTNISQKNITIGLPETREQRCRCDLRFRIAEIVPVCLERLVNHDDERFGENG